MNCRLCQNDNLRFFYDQGNENQFKYYKCSKCGLVNIDLSGLKITDHQEKYFAQFTPVKDYEAEKDARASYQFVKKYVPVKGNYLDIGCGNGAMLYFARKDGWQVKGLELSHDYAIYLKNALQVEVYVADFMKFDEIKGEFDLVSLRHVLEHLPDPILALNKISGLLKEGGYAQFEFPNINSLSHRFQRLLAKLKLHRRKYPKSYQPGHCNEFSRKSFQYLLNKTNFEMVRWETYSSKPLTNFFYNHFKFGTKVRTIVRKR